MDNGDMTKIEKSQKIIDDLGGCAEVARMLGLPNDDQNGTRLVYSWYIKGIPSKWQLADERLRTK